MPCALNHLILPVLLGLKGTTFHLVSKRPALRVGSEETGRYHVLDAHDDLHRLPKPAVPPQESEEARLAFEAAGTRGQPGVQAAARSLSNMVHQVIVTDGIAERRAAAQTRARDPALMPQVSKCPFEAIPQSEGQEKSIWVLAPASPDHAFYFLTSERKYLMDTGMKEGTFARSALQWIIRAACLPQPDRRDVWAGKLERAILELWPADSDWDPGAGAADTRRHRFRYGAWELAADRISDHFAKRDDCPLCKGPRT